MLMQVNGLGGAAGQVCLWPHLKAADSTWRDWGHGTAHKWRGTSGRIPVL